MGTRKIKTQVQAIIREPSMEDILDRLRPLPAKAVINALFFAICSSDELVHWHAVRAMGVTIARLADEEIEEARIVMRRLLWSLNDESGGIGWGAPESMAEAMYHHKVLAREYIHMLVSYTKEDGKEEWQDGNYLEHQVLQRGLIWGIGRLATRRKSELLQNSIMDSLPPYAYSTDATIRGLTAWALGRLGEEAARPVLEDLLGDENPVRLYEHDTIVTSTVDALAQQALTRLQG